MKKNIKKYDYSAYMRRRSRDIIPEDRESQKNEQLVVIACSTGGPQALQEVIPYLPEDIDAPVLVIQHMPEGFTRTLAERMNELSALRVKEAEHGEPIEKGCVYIAPGGKHMEVERFAGGSHRIVLGMDPPIGGLRPCADKTFESVIRTAYRRIVCVVMTGMGSDGTEGIKKLAMRKRIHVIAQDQKTSVVYGMPKVIRLTGLVNEVVSLGEIAETIIRNVGVRENGC